MDGRTDGRTDVDRQTPRQTDRQTDREDRQTDDGQQLTRESAQVIWYNAKNAFCFSRSNGCLIQVRHRVVSTEWHLTEVYYRGTAHFLKAQSM